jgi:hypothetical protein
VSSYISSKQWRAELLAPSLVFVSYALLITAWVFANPPHAAPDEWSHYLRAVSLGHGQLLGTPVGPEAATAIVGSPRPPFLTEQMYRDELAWVAQTTRLVRIPPGLTPAWYGCAQHDPRVSARCLHDARSSSDAREWLNPTATYQPFPYLIPAALSRIHLEPNNLDRLMRAGKATFTVALLGAALFLLWSPHAGMASLAGLIVAVTPMAVFLSGTLNPSGIEIAATVAFASALVRLTRLEAEPRLAWTTLAASGAVLALSRTGTPLWIALSVGLIVPIGGARSFVRHAARQKRYAYAAAGSVLAAIVLNRLWERWYGPTLPFDVRPFRSSVYSGLAQLPHVLREQVGVFNYLEFGLPMYAYALWAGLAMSLGVTALAVGNNRERLMLLAALGAALAVPVVLFAAIMRHTGFGLQGRYVLPCSVIVPLLAGEILVRRHERLRALKADHLIILFAAGAGIVQLVAWWTNARRFAVGVNGPRWFLSVAEWSPPGGWWPWLILAGVGAALPFATALVDRFRQRLSSTNGAHTTP